MRRTGSLLLTLAATAALSCHTSQESNIRPLMVSLNVAPVADDPAVFFQAGTASSDSVTIDVMIRTGAAETFDAWSLHVRFDPSKVSYGGFTQPLPSDGFTYDPFGQCNSSATYCSAYPYDPTMNPIPPGTTPPLCASTLASDANLRGEFIVSMAAVASSACNSYSKAGVIKVATLMFIASTTGTSTITIVPHATDPSGTFVMYHLAPLSFSFNDGGATVTATR